MLQTLNESTIKAGGCSFSVEKLKQMTAWELVTLLSPNRVRFTLIPEKEVKMVTERTERCKFCNFVLQQIPSRPGKYCHNTYCLG